MAFDPSEPRDPRGKWLKLAQGIKKLSEADHTTVANAIGELPEGGHGNRTSIKGVEVRRHQSGAVNVKINGESRQYASHEDAARAVIRREHPPNRNAEARDIHESQTGQRTVTGKVPDIPKTAYSAQPKSFRTEQELLQAARNGDQVAQEQLNRRRGLPSSHRPSETGPEGQYRARAAIQRLTSEQALKAHHDYLAGQGGRDVYGNPTTDPQKIAETSVLAQQARILGGKTSPLPAQTKATSRIPFDKLSSGDKQKAAARTSEMMQEVIRKEQASKRNSDQARTIKEQIRKLEDRTAHRSQSARLKGRGAPNNAADQRDREALLKLYEKLRQMQ